MGNKRGSSIVIVISNINCYKHLPLDLWRPEVQEQRFISSQFTPALLPRSFSMYRGSGDDALLL